MSAGLEVFSTEGYASSSVPAVCRRAGLSSRQFYAEFANREALLTALYCRTHEQAMEVVRDKTTALPPASSELTDWIRTALIAYLQFFNEDPRLVRICFIEAVGVNPEFEELRSQTRARWSSLLALASGAAAANGLIGERDRSLDWAVFLGAVNTSVVEYATRPEVSLDAVIETLLRLITTGIID